MEVEALVVTVTFVIVQNVKSSVKEKIIIKITSILLIEVYLKESISVKR